jgi:hypothetical protein
MNLNENQSSTIIEHWNVQCEQRVYEITEEECDRCLRPNEVFQYVPMYHIIEATKIRQVIFGVQENGPLSDCWKEDEGNLLIVSDRVNSWVMNLKTLRIVNDHDNRNKSNRFLQ